LMKQYFYFSGRLVFGGNWARLTAVQRAIYLGVATRARRFDQPPADNDLLRYALPAEVDRGDLLASFEAGQGQGTLRLAILSYKELSDVTGISTSALKEAVRLLKRREGWGTAGGDEEQLIHAPITAYPTDGGSLLYHFRDHAPPWWGLTDPPPPVRQAIAVDAEPIAAPVNGSRAVGDPSWPADTPSWLR
jgi:hypothetical protein